MICWYCHWGWPEQVAAIYRRGVEAAGETAMHFGPGHIVWSDENFDAGSIKGCIKDSQKYRGDLTNEEVASVVRSLNELLAVPEDVRCCEPEDYDGDNPENYPPPQGLKMVNRPKF